MDSERDFFAIATDTDAHTIVLTNKRDGVSTTYKFTYEQPTPDRLVLHGSLASVPVDIDLRKLDPNSFLLVHRGFRWVNEHPFNR